MQTIAGGIATYLGILLLAACSSPTSPSPTGPGITVTPAPPPVVVIPPPVIVPPVVTPPPSLPLSDARFDLTFYRMLAHDAIDGNRLPLWHWTRAPLIYLRTVDDQNAAVSPALLDQTAAAIINTASEWTGGAFGVSGLERGTGSRHGQSGWITIQWSTAGVCGTVSGYATEGVSITMNHRRPECTCGPLVIKHELGHAMGFYHTDRASDLMVGSFTGCDKPLSARERYHAAVAYSMPNGSPAP